MADIIPYSIENTDEIAARLKRGEVGIFPCDTIYGLCGRADERIAERLYEIKRRPLSKSFITLMDKSSLRDNGLIVPDDIFSRWPAPFTAILQHENGTTVAVRCPSDPYLLRILPVSGPIYSTSVNFSGEKSLLTFDDILPVFMNSVDFIVNDPTVKEGMASTIIDATSNPYRIIREGAYKFTF